MSQQVTNCPGWRRGPEGKVTQSFLGPGSFQLDLEPTSRVLVESGAPAAATPSLSDSAGPARSRGTAWLTRLAVGGGTRGLS